MAKKKSQKQSESPAPRRKWVRALVDHKVLATTIVAALLIGIPSAIWKGIQFLQERERLRTIISEEIGYRIPVAQRRVTSDVRMAKKYLDGVARSYCLHAELECVPLRTLLSDWESAGGEEIDSEIKRLASEPAPTQEQMKNLLSLLGNIFSEPTAPPAPSEADKKNLPPGLRGEIKSGTSARQQKSPPIPNYQE